MVWRLLAGLALWLVVALWMAASGLMREIPTSATLGGSAAGAFAGFLLLRRFSGRFSELVRSLDPAALTLVQASRAVGGSTLLWLSYRGVVPDSFGVPAGAGDIIAAVTAPLVAYGLHHGILGVGKAWLWHALGLAHLFAAVVLASLSSPVPGVLADGSSSQILNEFPFSMIPAFVGPVLILSHLAAMSNLRELLATGVSPAER